MSEFEDTMSYVKAKMLGDQIFHELWRFELDYSHLMTLDDRDKLHNFRMTTLKHITDLIDKQVDEAITQARLREIRDEWQSLNTREE